MTSSEETGKADITNAVFFSFTRRKALERAALVAVIALILLLATSCASRPRPSLSEPSRKYRPVMLASGVQKSPGGLAWSKDGRTLAFIDDSVNLFDVQSAERTEVRIAGPHFLNWSTDGKLFVLSRELERSALCSIDREGRTLEKLTINSEAEAVYATTDPRHLLVLSKAVKQFSLWTEFIIRMSTLDRETGTENILYAIDRTYPVKQLDLRFHLAWVHAGPNPVDNSLLIIEHGMPPMFGLYSRAFEIDPLTGLSTDISDKTRDHVFTSASWSPDGRMVALTDGNGHLSIRTIRGREIVLDPSFCGTYPSWSPHGHRIFAGGRLFDLGTNSEEILLTNSHWSIAEWSPDGGKLAVVSGGDLWLFSDILPPDASQRETTGHKLKEQMSLLQKLVRDGVLTLREYAEKHDKLMLGTEVKE